MGPEYYVAIMSFVDKTQLEPGSTVLLHNKASSAGRMFDGVGCLCTACNSAARAWLHCCCTARQAPRLHCCAFGLPRNNMHACFLEALVSYSLITLQGNHAVDSLADEADPAADGFSTR